MLVAVLVTIATIGYLEFVAAGGKVNLAPPPSRGSIDTKCELGIKGRRQLIHASQIVVSRRL